MIRVQCLSHTSSTCLQQDLILSEPVTKNGALLNIPAASQQRVAAVEMQVAALNKRGPCEKTRGGSWVGVAPGLSLMVLFADPDGYFCVG